MSEGTMDDGVTGGDGTGEHGQEGGAPRADVGERLVDDVEAGPGGVMTDEVGVVTGELTFATGALPDGRAVVEVQYTEADEWYTLTGSPVPLPDGGLAALHADVLERARRGGGAEAPR